MRKALFFDLDGTLIDSSKDIVEAMNVTRTDLGFAPYSYEEAIQCVGDGVDTLITKLLPELSTAELVDALKQFRINYGERESNNTALYPDVAQTLKALKASGAILAVVTNKPIENTNRILAQLEIMELFDYVVGCGSGFPNKPQPDAINFLLEKFNIQPCNCAMIGDHYADLAAGRGAGVVRVLAKWGFGFPRDETFDYAFSNFKELADWAEQSFLVED